MKKYFVYMLFFILLLSGCKQSFVDVSNNINDDNKTNADTGLSAVSIAELKKKEFSLLKKEVLMLEDINMVDSNSIFYDSKVLDYIDNVYFSPIYLNNHGVLFGYAYDFEDRNQTYLLAYELNTAEVKTLNIEKVKTYMEALTVHWARDNLVLIERYSNQSAQYLLYDLNTDDYDVIHETMNTPSMHIANVSSHGDMLMLNVYSSFTGRYELLSYSLETKQLENVEDENCNDPVYFRGLWYYLKIDNDSLKTELIAYDPITHEKKSIYQEIGYDGYLTWLDSDGENLYLTTTGQDVNRCYKLDMENSVIIPLFETSYMGSIDAQKGYMTWVGSKTIPNRSRLQYFLYDTVNNIHYLFDGGDICLSESGIMWIEYLKPEEEIMKGEVFTSNNSRIRYKSFH